MSVVDKDYEGILGIKLCNKNSDYTCIVYSCYLPPETSPWGRDGVSFFAHTMSQMYISSDADNFLICGRIGSKQDFDCQVDNIPTRDSIDRPTVVNQQGNCFIDFLNDSEMCILNGRTGNNDFTFISPRGSSVVDYVIIPHDMLQSISDFNIETCQFFMSRNHLESLLHETSKIPDHAIVRVMLE